MSEMGKMFRLWVALAKQFVERYTFARSHLMPETDVGKLRNTAFLT